MARKTAEVIFVGDASSIIRAAGESKAAIDSINSSSVKATATMGGMSKGMKALIGTATITASALAGIGAVGVGAGVAFTGLAASVMVLDEGFKALKATHGGFAAQVKSTQAEFQKMMGQAAEPLLKPMEQAMKQVGQLEPALHSLFSGAAQMIQPLASGIMQVAKVGLPQLGNVMKASSGLIKPLADGFSSLIKTMGPIFTQTIKAMQPLMAPLIKGLGGMLAGLMTGVNVMLKAIGPAIKPLMGVFVQIGKVVGDLFTALAPALKPATQILSTLIGVVGSLLVPVGNAVDSISRGLAPAFTQFAKVITGLIPVLMPFVKTILTSLGSALTQIAPLLTRVVTTLMHDLAPALPTLVKLFAQLVKVGIDVLVKAVVQLTPVFVKLINGVVIPFIPVLVKLTPLIALAAKLLGEGLIKAIKLLTPVLSALVGGIATVNKAIDGWVAHVLPSARQVMSFLKSAWDTIRSDAVSAWNSLTKWLVGAWDGITNSISTFGHNMASGISSAFDTAANDVIGFVDDIIKAIDLIPGVHIKQIAKIGTTASVPNTGTAGNRGVPGHAVGGKVTTPMYMVGEEAPKHPEYVIATNPAYKRRNMGLWAAAGRELGIPGFAQGGVPVTGRFSGNPQGTINPKKISAFGSVGKTVSSIVGNLPGVGSLPGWLGGMGSSVLGDVTGWIKHKVSSVISSLFGGGGAPSGAGGPVPAGSARDWLVKALKITGEFSPANLSALYGRMIQESGGNPHAINLWDSNAKAGHPSEGLLQTIGPTFAQYMMPGMGNIWNPIDNAVAAIRYMMATYGHIVGPSGSGYAKGGIVGASLGAGTSQANNGLAALNALMGPRGSYAKYGEDISYYPSLWQISNPLFGSGASSFINTTDALGNPIPPTVNSSGLKLTLGEEGQELGWYGAQIADIRQAIPIAMKIAPMIRKQIIAIREQIRVIQQQIKANLAKIHALSVQITKAQNKNEPYPNPKNKSQRAANAAFKTSQHDLIYGKDGTGGLHGQINHIQAENQALGGTQTTVGTGGRIGALSKRISNLQTSLGNVTGSGPYSPLTLEGATGLGGMLGPDILQYKTLQAELASIMGANIPLALAAAQASYTAGLGSSTGAAPVAPGTVPAGPTTSQELASLLAGMPPLYGGGRASGGPVRPGYVYRVGEQGPEDVVFGRSGTVLTASQTRQGGGAMMHIEHAHFSGATAAKAAVDRLAYRAAIGVA